MVAVTRSRAQLWAEKTRHTLVLPPPPPPHGGLSVRDVFGIRRQPASARFRLGWLAVLWVTVILPFTVFGGYYAVAGSPAPSSNGSTYVVLERNMFWGLHGHGVVQLLIAAWLIHSLGPTLWGYPERRRVTWALLVAGSYAGLTAIAFICAPFAGGTEGLGCVWWIVASLNAYGAVTIDPPSYYEVVRDRRKLARKYQSR